MNTDRCPACGQPDCTDPKDCAIRQLRGMVARQAYMIAWLAGDIEKAIVDRALMRSGKTTEEMLQDVRLQVREHREGAGHDPLRRH